MPVDVDALRPFRVGGASRWSNRVAARAMGSG